MLEAPSKDWPGSLQTRQPGRLLVDRQTAGEATEVLGLTSVRVVVRHDFFFGFVVGLFRFFLKNNHTFSTLYLYFYLIVQTMPHDCVEEGHDYQPHGGGVICRFCLVVVPPPGKI
jgi:hypothetical protein